MTPVFAFGLSPMSVVVLLLLGVLLFGRKLPEMGKYLGKGIVEFKKGLRGMEDEIDAGRAAPRQDPTALEAPRPPQRIQQAPAIQQAAQSPEPPKV